MELSIFFFFFAVSYIAGSHGGTTFPAIGNEFIFIIKDSSLVSMIGIAEINYTARAVQGGAPSSRLPPLLLLPSIL
ncbi:hypothetical protein [Paenibacillus xylanivorans]|uniref:hypothetical protein n=1 Tax=Paenibacillus xylanivorans TaxID=1705561 RepID=UPI001F1BB510|nr:hypothetical protein [Paenibacillus xylanivorans]